MRWYTHNSKKVIDGINIKYGKIEPNYRKTDGFKAFVAAMAIEDEIPEEVDYGALNFDVYSY